MENKKMTRKEFLNGVIAMAIDAGEVELREFAEVELERDEAKRAKAREKVGKENEVLMEVVCQALGELDKPVTAGELIQIQAVKDAGIASTQKAAAILKKLVAEEAVEKKVDKKKTYYSKAN